METKVYDEAEFNLMWQTWITESVREQLVNGWQSPLVFFDQEKTQMLGFLGTTPGSFGVKQSFSITYYPGERLIVRFFDEEELAKSMQTGVTTVTAEVIFVGLPPVPQWTWEVFKMCVLSFIDNAIKAHYESQIKKHNKLNKAKSKA